MNYTDTNTLSHTEVDTSGPREAALAVIAELAAQGHAYHYIARALDIRGVPTLTPRARTWNAGTVWKLMQRHGIQRAPARMW